MSAQELLAIAQRVAGQAQPDEQVEAFVERERETSVRVYEGEIEHLTSAQVEGVGVRVIKDGRVGFAYSGTLDDASLAEVLAEARDNVAFGTTDEWAGLAVPDGVAPAPVELWRDALDGFATEDKVALAKELERLTVGLDPRLRVEDANYADVLGESAVATSTGIAASGRATGCYVSVSTMADDGDETQTGFGFSVGREPADLVLAKAAGDGADRALRMLGATKPSSRKVTVVLDPFVTAQFLGVLSATLNGEAVLKGRSLFAHRMGEQVAAPIVTLVDDATNVQAFSATPLDGEGLATRRSTLIDAGFLRGFVHNSYSGRRSGTASTGNATRGGFKSTPGCGCLALSLTPGTRPQRDLIADIGDGVLIQMVQGLHSGVNPVSGDFSTGASGLLIAGGELGAPIREFTIGSTIQRMLQDVVEVGADVEWLPMSAAGVSLVIRDVTMSGA
jgi:PmbA protein